MSLHITPLTDPHRGANSRRLAWLASGPDGFPLGSAYLRLFEVAGQDHLAELSLHVHPAERRHGVGSRLLATALDAARDAGRRSLGAQVETDSPGDDFLAAAGFRKVLAFTYTRLALDGLKDTDVAALIAAAERPHPGYRLISWEGTVPDGLAGTYTASRRAMDDMPMEDYDYGAVVWDVERIRAAARAVEQRGELLHTVAVVAEEDDCVVGFTELVVPGNGRGDGQHYGTGILPEHRGRGLGRWAKAASILRARTEHPHLGGLLTDTADSNRAMRAINDALGYVPIRRTLQYQYDLGALQAS